MYDAEKARLSQVCKGVEKRLEQVVVVSPRRVVRGLGCGVPIGP